MTKLQNPSSVCNEIGTCACALEDLKMLQPIRHDKCSLAMYRDHRAFEKRRRKFEKMQIREKRRKKKNPKPLKELFRAGYTWLHHDLPELKRAVLSMQRNMTKVLDAAFARRGADNMGSVVVVNPLVLSEDFYRLIVQHECLASIIKGYLGPSAQLDDAFLQRNIPRQLTPEEEQKAWISSEPFYRSTVSSSDELKVIGIKPCVRRLINPRRKFDGPSPFPGRSRPLFKPPTALHVGRWTALQHASCF